MRELVFEVTEEPEGSYSAESVGESIFTQGDTWAELSENVLDATKAHLFDASAEERVSAIRLMLRKNEVFAVA